MTLSRALRCIMVAILFGALFELTVLCESAAFIGAVITLAIGLVALMCTPRAEKPGESFVADYLAWLLCVFVFAVTTIAIAALIGGLGWAAAIALCICSPLLGTMVYVVERWFGRLSATQL